MLSNITSNKGSPQATQTVPIALTPIDRATAAMHPSQRNGQSCSAEPLVTPKPLVAPLMLYPPIVPNESVPIGARVIRIFHPIPVLQVWRPAGFSPSVLCTPTQSENYPAEPLSALEITDEEPLRETEATCETPHTRGKSHELAEAVEAAIKNQRQERAKVRDIYNHVRIHKPQLMGKYSSQDISETPQQLLRKRVVGVLCKNKKFGKTKKDPRKHFWRVLEPHEQTRKRTGPKASFNAFLDK